MIPMTTERAMKPADHPWLGTLPMDWQLVPAKALFAHRAERSGPDDAHLTPSQKYGVVTQAEYMEITGSKVVLNLTGADTMKRVEPGDFVIHLRSFQGGIERSSLAGKVSTAYTVLRPRNGVAGRFYGYLLKSDRYVQALRVVVNQLRDGQSIRYQDFAKVPLPLPPLEEQRAIADFLDRETAKIDALIDKQNQMIDLLRERRLSAINAVLFSAVGVRGTPLRNVVDIQSGITLGKTYGPGTAVQEYPYLRVANVQTGYVNTDDLATIELPPSVASRVMLRDGDVLITEGGDRAALARGSLWRGQVDPCLHQNHLYALRPKPDGLLAKYLVYVLEGSEARQYFERTRRQTTNLSATNSRLVRAFRFTLPTVVEQHSLVQRLDGVTAVIDSLIAKAEELVALATERRAALITAAVTGQVEVLERVS